MSEKEKAIEKIVQRMENVSNRFEVELIMMHLQVLQLDGKDEISNETMRLYINALSGEAKDMKAFREHCLDVYFHD